jgi:hypothetical protein
LTYLGDLRFRFTMGDGARLRPDQLSFGQRRLFAFFYYAAIHDEVIVADELSNGMHHAMIGQCIDLVGERQAFLATQNPLLLDSLGFSERLSRPSARLSCAAANARRTAAHGVAEHDRARRPRNFYREYQVGIGHTNDILRSWGLW